MYCTNCGTNLPDDSIFCSKCGTKVKFPEKVEHVPEEVEQTPDEVVIETPDALVENNKIQEEKEVIDEAPVIEMEIEQEESIKKKKGFSLPIAEIKNRLPSVSIKSVSKKKKLLLIVGAGVILIALIIAVVAMLISGGSNQTVKAEPDVIYARMTEDGKAYIPLMDGRAVAINKEVEKAVITKDRKNVVVFLEDGTLYVTNPTLEEKHNIADNCSSLADVLNEGFFYRDEDDNVFRVLFSDYSKLNLGKFVAVSMANNSMTVLYATDDGNIYSLPANSNENQKIGIFNDSISLEGISDDGQISIWVTKKNNVNTIILNDGDNKYTLGEVNNKSDYTYVTFSADQKMAVVTNAYSNRMWIMSAGQEPIEVKLGAEPDTSTVFTNLGRLEDSPTSKITSLYIATEGESGANLYNISLDGDRERVISKVKNFEIANGKIVYLNTDNTLCYAKLNGSSIEQEEKITSDVEMFDVSQNGQYVYYLKDANQTGSLYCYKVGTDEPQKIASDASCYVGSYFKDMYTYVSTDGKTVWFMKDVEEIKDTYSDQGTLMMWSYGDESATRIASEVITYTVTSGLDTREVNKNSFMFLKYSSVDSDETIFGNWMYFNGKEATRFATDVIK